MKKFLIVLLTLSLMFAFTACGNTESSENKADDSEIYTAIPLGGELGDYALDGSEFGEYTLMDEVPEALIFDDTETTAYIDEDAAIPYIVVYRWTNTEGLTLEEAAKEEASVEGTVVKSIAVDETTGVETAIMRNGEYSPFDSDKYTYYELRMMLDGDDIVELAFAISTEEVAWGDSGLYIYVPVDYNDMTAEHQKETPCTIFSVNYDYFNLPGIWMCAHENTYAGTVDAWHDAEGFNVTEEQWNAFNDSGWTEADLADFYAAVGAKMNDAKTKDINGVTINYQIVENAWWSQGATTSAIINTSVDNIFYEININAVDNVHGMYLDALINSIHTK